MRPDLLALHHAGRAKTSGMSPADYASAVTRFESKSRAYPVALWLAMALGFIVAIVAALDWI